MARLIPTRRALREAWLALGFFALAYAALVLTRFENGPAFVWTATALLFARLSLLPERQWPLPMALCALASFTSSLLNAFPFAVEIGVAAIVVSEAAGAAWLLRRLLGGSAYYESPKGVAAFALVVGLIVPALSATAAATLVFAMFRSPFAPLWTGWFAAHGLGTLVFSPVLMLAMRGELVAWFRRSSSPRRLEAFVLLALVSGVTAAVFMQSRLPLLFVPTLPIMVATLRLGRAGATLSIMLLAVIGGAYTICNVGPISGPAAEGARLQLFQVFLATTTLLVLPVAALMRQHRQLLSRLTESEARYRLMAERSADAILSVTPTGTILYASPAVRQVAGYDPALLIGQNIMNLVHEADIANVRAIRARTLLEPASMFTVEYRASGAGGALRWYEATMRAVIDTQGRATGTVSAIRDVTSRKDTEARLSAAANTDALTGLPNRRAFGLALAARLNAVRGDGLNASLALFDIDWFKTVNDRHGHAAGDAVLVAFAHSARRMLREGDCLARIGGEEFGLILSVSGPEEAERVCERLRRVLSDTPVQIEGGLSVQITISAGIAPLRPQDDEDAVMRVADTALYRAKAAGRDRLVRAA